MRPTGKKKTAPMVCAGVFILVLAVILAFVFFPLIRETYGISGVTAILIVYAAVILVVIGGICAALRSRLREIDLGEEEEAKKY